MNPVPDAPGVAQRALLVGDADHERAQPAGAPALAGQPAADDRVGRVDVLDLDPAGRAAAGQVGAVEPLGDHALELLGARQLEQRAAVADVMRRRLPGRPAQLELGQRRAALVVAQAHQRAAVEVEQVERDVVHGVIAREPPHGVLGGEVHAPLQLLEARPRAVERDHLAVEHDLAPRERLRQRPQLGVARGHVAAAAGLQDQAPALHERDRAHPVPLDLERPAPVVGPAAGRCARASARAPSGIGSRSGSSGGSMRWIIQSSPLVRNST